MDLPEDDPESFERLVQWLYCKTYDISPAGGTPCDNDQIVFMDLARLYVAADKYGIVGLKNDVVDRWYKNQDERNQLPRINRAVDYVYENTAPSSKLREMIVACYVWHIDYDWYKRPATRTKLYKCPEFATDVAIAMSRRIADDQKDPLSLGSSHFHEAIADKTGSMRDLWKAGVLEKAPRTMKAP